ncbi:hypothetical protein K466DRAFT_654526 [Polyporus arcularius HHB13444]|uniref:CST complex subunit STN1 n=1 Tax=Polyporus arcularius HHB13444 TaxID=1314778 RepID=A0A5C3P600_9APHY|nr:hypothetical protein K466DRAFT_654526 [Polyporus arcularius HHB13444]
MSHTSTIPRTRTTISRNTSSILLSPTKRRRTDSEQPSRSKEDGSRRNDIEEIEVFQPIPAEILRWTFTKAAVASCFVRDVFEMRECGLKDMEYFWLGRIPCRTVRLVGLIVGVQVWEKRTVYTLDDGTAVVDCAMAHAQARPPPSPAKRAPPAKPAASIKDTTKGLKPSYGDYLLSARNVPLSSSAASSSIASSSRRSMPEPSPPPKPVARVGQSALVVGRVVIRHDTRIVLVDEIVPCASYNDESTHCIAVSDLHRTAYYPSEPLPPFIPPPLPASATSASQRFAPTSPSKRAATQEPQTPASVRSAASSTTTSPSTSVASSSPSSSTAGEHLAPRLRHPSRLHTRDLTANTFRIYVKHYMDNAPPPPRPRRRARSRSPSPSPTTRHSQRQGDSFGTPIRSLSTVHNEATPRPSRVSTTAGDRTPRAFGSGAISDDDSDDESDDDNQMYGYSLSHLRRVPELSLLARRVVKADAHRRHKEERQKAKAKGSRSQQPSASSASSASASHATTDAPLGPAIKRLFKQAIRTLFSEGDIVLWNGPVHPLPAPALDPFLPSSSGLWKVNASTTSVATSVSSSASASRYEQWDEDEVLSDPAPDEEAYVPLTPAYFSRVLEGAIRTIMAESASSGEATPKKPASRGTSLIERLRAQEKACAGPPPGPTKEELLVWLRRSDERWARVGEWTVAEALEWGKQEGRVWCVGKGRWEVCG